MLFSHRNDLIDEDKTLIRLRKRVWNAFNYLLEKFYTECVFSDVKSLNTFDANGTVLPNVADKLGLDIANEGAYSIYFYLQDYIKNTSQINYIFDLIEAHLETLFELSSLPFGITGVNLKAVQDMATASYERVLQDENLPYQLHGKHIIPLVSDSELDEIETAAATKYESVNRHIEKAWLYFADRKKTDYENSIKESISAVEAMCCIINGKDTTLNKALAQLGDHGVHIHPALKNGFISLYGYTCDEKGIRHAGSDFVDAPAEDAKYMLITCSAFVNYLIEKWSKIDLEGSL